VTVTVTVRESALSTLPTLRIRTGRGRLSSADLTSPYAGSRLGRLLGHYVAQGYFFGSPSSGMSSLQLLMSFSASLADTTTSRGRPTRKPMLIVAFT